jgi:hypothetical protein
VSGDRSSLLRKRALRRLSREQPAAYSTLYEQVLSKTPGLTRYQARGQAWTRLRHEFPDRYLELFALGQSGIETEVPPDIRGRSWQRASAQLAYLRKTDYRSRFAGFRAQGMSPLKAYERADAALRDRDPGLFARLLAEEYLLGLAGPLCPATQAGGTGPPSRGTGHPPVANAQARPPSPRQQ